MSLSVVLITVCFTKCLHSILDECEGGKLRQILNRAGEIVRPASSEWLALSTAQTMFPFAQASVMNPQLYKLE